VLVDQDVTWQKDQAGYKRVLAPPPPEKLKVIRELVAGITGFSQERGDQLTIDTLPFETTLLLEPPDASRPKAPVQPQAGKLPFNLDQKMLLIGAGALVLVVVGLVVALLTRRGRSRVVEVAAPAELPGSMPEPAPAVAAPSAPRRHSSDMERQIESQLAERDALQQKLEEAALSSLKLTPVITKKAEVFAKHLRDKITKEPDVSVQILKSWIREEGE